MKKIFHTLLITTLFVSTAAINGMKRSVAMMDDQNQLQESVHLPDEVIVPIAAYSEPKEKNILMKVCKQFQQCLQNGRDQIIAANPCTVAYADREEAIFGAVRIDGAYPGGARADKYWLVQRLFDTKSIDLLCIENILGKTPLHYAENNQAMIDLLIKSPKSNSGEGSLNAITKNMQNNFLNRYINMPKPEVNPLHEATYQGNAKEVQRLLALKETNPYLALANSNTPLYIAAHEGHTNIVKLLLAADEIDINQANKSGCTPLYIATHKGHTEIIKLLLTANGIQVDKASRLGVTPLRVAAFGCHTEIVKLLIDNAANINQADNNHGWTPLYVAAQQGRTETVKLLLTANGIQVNKGRPNPNTPLCAAAHQGHTEIVKLLLTANGIKVNKANSLGITPLHAAISQGHAEIVKLLIDAGADINQTDDSGLTPLYEASKGGNVEMVKLLLAVNGIDVNHTDPYSWTPLHVAATFGHTEIARLLIDAGAYIRNITYARQSALQIAQENGNHDIVKLLEAQLQRDQKAEMPKDKKELIYDLEDFIDSL